MLLDTQPPASRSPSVPFYVLYFFLFERPQRPHSPTSSFFAAFSPLHTRPCTFTRRFNVSGREFGLHGTFGSIILRVSLLWIVYERSVLSGFLPLCLASSFFFVLSDENDWF
jgi:hypothetical protein